MTDPEGRADAEHYAGEACAQMNERRIPATPQNYTIWYSYVAGDHARLTEEIDKLLAAGGVFSPEVSDRLFAKYFGGNRTRERFQRDTAQLRVAIDTMVSRLGKADDDASDYDRAMTDFSGAVDRLKEARNWALEQRFDERTAELNDLRNNLAQLTKETTTDALTGIANRKRFDAALHQETRQADSDGTSLCLLLADVDHFKKFNDTFGHRVGDLVLQSVAKIIENGVTGRHLAARYGGEEFAVVLPRTALDEAAATAEVVRQALASKELMHRETGRSYGTVTLSIGLAQRRPGEGPDDLIGRADAALYRAKNGGRNRVVSDSGGDAAGDAPR